MPAMRGGVVTTLVALGALCWSSCENTVQPTPVGNVLSVSVTPGSVVLTAGERTTLVATVTAEAGVTDRSVTWSSSNQSIATVDVNGVVTAVGGGTTTIRAVSRANTAVSGSSSVNVIGLSPVSAMEVRPSTLAFTHTLLTSLCPQSIGTITIENTGNQPLELTVASANAALSLDRTTANLAAGASQQVAVSFNCTTQTGFTATVTVTGKSGSSTLTGSVVVTGTINR
jgi:hypothetical protein